MDSIQILRQITINNNTLVFYANIDDQLQIIGLGNRLIHPDIICGPPEIFGENNYMYFLYDSKLVETFGTDIDAIFEIHNRNLRNFILILVRNEIYYFCVYDRSLVKIDFGYDVEKIMTTDHLIVALGTNGQISSVLCQMDNDKPGAFRISQVYRANMRIDARFFNTDLVYVKYRLAGHGGIQQCEIAYRWNFLQYGLINRTTSTSSLNVIHIDDRVYLIKTEPSTMFDALVPQIVNVDRDMFVVTDSNPPMIDSNIKFCKFVRSHLLYVSMSDVIYARSYSTSVIGPVVHIDNIFESPIVNLWIAGPYLVFELAKNVFDFCQLSGNLKLHSYFVLDNKSNTKSSRKC